MSRHQQFYDDVENECRTTSEHTPRRFKRDSYRRRPPHNRMAFWFIATFVILAMLLFWRLGVSV